MRSTPWLAALLAILTFVPTAKAVGKTCRLAGTVVNHTHNQLRDRRIWSPALCEHRDLYVYLPPGYEPCKQYPLIIWLHGMGVDEKMPAESVICEIDRAIVDGCLPPVIVAIPDGSRGGHGGFMGKYTFFVNSKLGCFENYLEEDVWNFVTLNYPIRPEREAHVLAGFSGGGLAAYYHAIRYKDRYGVVLGFAPPLNIRWLDCHGRYFSKFDPDCWGWRESVRPGHQVIGRFYGVVTFRISHFVYPLFGRGPDAIVQLSAHNPIEMLDTCDVQPGELSMYVGFNGRDQFNIDTQVESFLFRARERGLEVDTDFDARGRHNARTLLGLLPLGLEWLGPRIAPYSPDACAH